MEPVTHALASVALSRAGLNRVTRLATPLVLTAGLAADFDLLSMAGGARAYLAAHRTVTHSAVGAAVLAVLIAGIFWWRGRRHPTAPLRFGRVFVVCGIAAGVHILLDLTNSDGVRLLWPFRDTWYAWDLMDTIDPWVLLALLVGLLLPELFRLVTEEIGARPRGRGAQRGAILALALLGVYCGARYILHDRAILLLGSRLYRGATPLATGAFPTPASPLTWRGVVNTENTVEELELSLAPGSEFDPDRSRTHYKPESSPVLEAARRTAAAQKFLKFARFPIASVEKLPDGYRVGLRDLRFGSDPRPRRSVVTTVELDERLNVTQEELRFR